MAFSRSPTEDTVSTKRISLARQINARDGGLSGKDEDFLNVFMEPVGNNAVGDQRMYVNKRSGSNLVVASVAAANIRGWYFWEDQNKLIYAVGANVYIYNVNTAASTTLAAVFGTTTGHVGMCEYLYDNNTAVIIVTDGTTLAQIDTANTKTVCVDADMPAHLPYPVYLDGYLFVVKTASADIYNSDLNNPMSWTGGSFISAEMEGDFLTRIAKINNYIVAFGSNSIEYFWDAANVGSPLQRNDTPIKLNTYLAGFAQFGNVIYYIGVDESGQPDVYKLKDFNIENLGTPTISRYLNTANVAVGSWTAGIVASKGHTFYIINAGTTKTYALDLETKLWDRWAWKQTAVFPIQDYVGVITTNNAYSYFTIADGTSNIYKMNDTVYQDNATTFTCVITPEKIDFGTMNRKTMRRLTVLGDRPSTNASIDISWSDDDFQTFNTARSVNLNQNLPSTYNLGWSRQRCFKLSYTANENLRLQELEVEINKGR